MDVPRLSTGRQGEGKKKEREAVSRGKVVEKQSRGEWKEWRESRLEAYIERCRGLVENSCLSVGAANCNTS